MYTSNESRRRQRTRTNQLASADDTTIMNDTAPTTSPRPKVKKNKIRPKLKPIVSTDDADDDEGLGYAEWKKPASGNNNTLTTTNSPQPKAKKNIKIRPKLKPIVSTDEGDDDDDEGLGYGEWAPSPKPSPIKPRQILSESGSSEEDETKVEEDAIHAIQNISSKFIQPPPTTTTNEKEEKDIQPEIRLDNDVVTSSKPITQNKRDFDNKLQQFFENTGDEKVSDNRTSTTTNATTHQKGMEAEMALQWLWSRIWKGALLLLCIALCCEVLSVAIIAKMSLSHYVEGEALLSNKELTSNNATMDENIAGEVLWSSREEHEDVPDIELLGIEEEESVERTIENVLPSDKASMSVISVADDEQYNKQDEGSAIHLPEGNELGKIEEDATEDGIHPEIEISSSTEEEKETQASHPSSKEDEGSEPDVSEQSSDCDSKVEEYMLTATEEVAPSETTAQIVPVTIDEDLDANSTLEVAYDEVSGVASAEATENEDKGFESDDEQPSAMQTPESESTVNEVPDTDNYELEAVEKYLPPPEAVVDDIEYNDEQPNTNAQEHERLESLASEPPETYIDELETEVEYLPSVEDVPVSETTIQMTPETIDGELDAQITLDPSGSEGLDEELDANEVTNTNLVEAEAGMKVEASGNNKQPEPAIEPLVEATDGYETGNTPVEEVSTGDMQPTTQMYDAVMPAAEPELDAKIELIEEEPTTSEDGSDQQPKPEVMKSVVDNNHVENVDQNAIKSPHKQPVVLPRTNTIETKHEFLSQLEKFEEAFESYEVIDALVGHVATAIPKLLLKRILGATMKAKGRFLKKKRSSRRE